MATRPVFVPRSEVGLLVESIDVEFEWFPGFAASQKQLSIESLHSGAQSAIGPGSYLEVSSKSPDLTGTRLSAFNLTVEGFGENPIPVECAFQGSKVFEGGGPFTDLYGKSPLDAKRDPRLTRSGELTGFRTRNREWELVPTTAFYDWVYLQALTDNPDLIGALKSYRGFTDIEFNPKKSLNCQARSCALAAALVQTGFLDDALSDPDAFIEICYPRDPLQNSLFE